MHLLVGMFMFFLFLECCGAFDIMDHREVGKNTKELKLNNDDT